VSLCLKVVRLRFHDNQDLVVKILRHQPNRDSSKGMPDEVLDIRFGDVERPDGNLALAFA
jgi:hypothetical protein